MFKNEDGEEPKIVYTVPYSQYLRFERWKFVFWVSVTVTILFNVFMANLAILMAVVPKPIMNQLMGITPEEVRIRARNDAIIERYERFQKQERAREKALADARKKAISDAASKNYKANIEALVRNAHISEETARWRAFK